MATLDVVAGLPGLGALPATTPAARVGAAAAALVQQDLPWKCKRRQHSTAAVRLRGWRSGDDSDPSKLWQNRQLHEDQHFHDRRERARHVWRAQKTTVEEPIEESACPSDSPVPIDLVQAAAPPSAATTDLPTGAGWKATLPHAMTAALANFCFGYHIGIFNGPLASVAAELGFAGNALTSGFVVSIFLVGAFLGSFGGGLLADWVGRRRNFQLDAIPLIIGSLLSANAHSVAEMAAGRFLVGVGVGAAAGFVALYISEVAPTKYRGALGCIPQVGTCLGIIAALLTGLPAESDPHWWRAMFWISNVPTLALAGGMQFAAESPRWLSKAGHWAKARENLEHLWGADQLEAAMGELEQADEVEKDVEGASWGDLLSPQYLKVTVISSLLFVLQQFAGINGVLYFSSETFQQAGISNGMLASAAVGVANLLGAISVVPLMDSRGRKPLLITSYGGMAACMAILVAALVLPLSPDMSHLLSVAGTLGYVYMFALGAGPVTALLIPELCSTRVRAKTLGASMCVHWVCNFAIGLFFLELVQRFGVPTIYTGFGAVSLLSVLFTTYFIIETKGRSLEDIERELNA